LVLVPIIASTSTVISSGSTGGTVSGVASRVYVDVLNNTGTVELAWHQTVSGVNLLNFRESAVVTTTAEGGAGAADSAGVMYSTTARTNVAFRCAGYFESTQATAGTWASAATLIQQMGLGIRRTGDIIQAKYSATGAVATGTTALPFDDTIPQNTEGDEFQSLAVTPSSAINLLRIVSVSELSQSTGGTVLCAALFQDSVVNALAARYHSAEGVAAISPHGAMLQHVMQAGTVSSTTFKVRAGSSAGTVTFNGTGGARRFGGVMNSFIEIHEMMA
jgi:hypothetical protein